MGPGGVAAKEEEVKNRVLHGCCRGVHLRLRESSGGCLDPEERGAGATNYFGNQTQNDMNKPTEQAKSIQTQREILLNSVLDFAEQSARDQMEEIQEEKWDARIGSLTRLGIVRPILKK